MRLCKVLVVKNQPTADTVILNTNIYNQEKFIANIGDTFEEYFDRPGYFYNTKDEPDGIGWLLLDHDFLQLEKFILAKQTKWGAEVKKEREKELVLRFRELEMEFESLKIYLSDLA